MSYSLTIFLEPLDVLVFRDHRPFDAGLSSLAESSFPLPSVTFGFLRTALLNRLPGVDFDQRDFGLKDAWAQALVGTKDEPGPGLRLRGPFAAERGGNTSGGVMSWFPADRASSELSSGKAATLSPREPGAGAAVSPVLHMRRYHWRAASVPDGGILTPRIGALPWTGESLEKPGATMLQTGGIPGRRRPSSDLYDKEERTGIGRDTRSGSVEEGLLYLVQTLRFEKGCGIALEATVDTPDAQKAVLALNGQVQHLGGRNHLVRIHVCVGALPSLQISSQLTGPKYRVWFVTPWAASLDMLSDNPPPGVKLVTAVTDRPIRWGGFSLAERSPKPLASALPAGTILFLESSLTPTELLTKLNNCQPEGARAAGFGTALLDTWS